MDYKSAFLMMGIIVIASSFLSVLIHIPCHAGLLWGEDNHTVIQSRERYRRQRERARQAMEEQNQARHNPNPEEGEATVESMDKGEQGSEEGDAASPEEPKVEAPDAGATNDAEDIAKDTTSQKLESEGDEQEKATRIP